MDTKKDSAAAEVPTFKVARVGNDRKRKGGAFSFLRSGGARGVWTGATGGSGAGGAAAVNAFGMSLSKVMMALMLSSVITSAAVYYGAHSAANTAPAPKKASVFSHDKDAVKLEGDTTNLPSNANTIPNSLGYVAGSKDGLTPEERAKKEADAAAAAEAQRIADEEAAKKAAKENTAAAPVDPNALLASAKADGGDKDAKGTAFGKKFGALSSSMGGGSSLTGGAGLSGGVNRQFGAAGAITKGGGQLTAMKGSAKTTTSKAASPRLAGSKVKGFARKQLANANAYSRRGMAAGKGETASSDASSAFDNNPGAGTIISGPGISRGTKPQGEGDTATPNGGGGNGSPTGDQSGECGAGQAINASGACQKIDTNGGKDANPALTMMANVVMAMLLVIGVIAAMAISGPWGYWMGSVLVAMGAIITLLGVAMMAMGDYVTGGIATLTGGVVTALAWTGALTVGQGLIAGFAAPALMMVGKMLDKGNHKAPEAAQQ